MRKIKIHFVCLGNAYRSRLAEAYAKSLGLNNFEFSSSGVAAHLFEQRLPQHTEIPAKAFNLKEFLSPGQVQTSSELLAKQDLIIFMKHDVLDQARNSYKFDERKVLCWDIDDLWQALLKAKISENDSKRVNHAALEVFAKIRRDFDRLHPEITKTNWIDIYDDNNEPLNFRHPIGMANDKGLWHRGIHSLVLTADNKYVIEKRSQTLMMARGLLDVSLGGYVDAGEHPDSAAVRETNEELGLNIDPSQISFLQVTKGSSWHPHYKKHTNGFTYSYLVKLRPGQDIFKPQISEVANIYLLSGNKVRRLIRRHYLSPFGQLNYPYKLYKTDLKLAKKLS